MTERTLTVGRLRQQAALCASDVEVLLLDGGGNVIAKLVDAYPDSCHPDGTWGTVLKIVADFDLREVAAKQIARDLVERKVVAVSPLSGQGFWVCGICNGRFPEGAAHACTGQRTPSRKWPEEAP